MRDCPTHTTDEIVRYIVAALDGGSEIETTARELVRVARDLKDRSPMVGNQRRNAQYAKRVLKQIDELEKLFANPPDGAVLEILFAPRQTAPVNSLERFEAVAWEAKAWRQDWLISLRSRCEWIIADRIGESGKVGSKQRKAAIVAKNLCQKAGKPLAWSSSTSAYRLVASYFYEAMTGEQGRDMERECEWALRQTQTAK